MKAIDEASIVFCFKTWHYICLLSVPQREEMERKDEGMEERQGYESFDLEDPVSATHTAFQITGD